MYEVMQTFDFPGWLEGVRAGVPYRKMAQKIGISPGHLNNLEKGTAKPSETDLRLLAATFEVDPEWLIAHVDTTKPDLRERIERIKKHVPEFLGLPAKPKLRAVGSVKEAKEPKPPTYVTPRVAAGEGIHTFEPDRVEHDEVDRPFSEDT